MPTLHDTDIVKRFVAAFDAADRPGLVDCLAEDLVADVTQADGSTRQIVGRDPYMAAIDAMHIDTVRPSVRTTQSTQISPGRVLIMVEIRAIRKGRSLHNFATFLMVVRDARICRIWMVEARPAESDAFWKD